MGSRSESRETVGRYRLFLELAAGGMGTVYLARSEGPGGFEKLLALKRIHPHLAKDPKFVAMFLDEARIAARIQHPNVCSVLDFGQAEEGYFLTMPFVVGEPMNRLLNQVQQKPSLKAGWEFYAARLVADACEGLHAAHELRDDHGQPMEVVHRDVTPQNLLVGYDGIVRVLDFGVATAKHRHYRTTTGELKGKFGYVSPEQVEAHPVDRRSDVWSLGVVLWEAIALRRLFRRDEFAATMRAVVSDPVPSLRTYRAGISLAFDEIVFKALARPPDQRYQSAREMGRDLLALLGERTTTIGPADVAEFMHLAFPDGEAEKRRLYEHATSVEIRIPETRDSADLAEPTDVDTDRDDFIESQEHEPTIVDTALAKGRKRWPTILIGLGLLAAAMLGGAAISLALNESPNASGSPPEPTSISAIGHAEDAHFAPDAGAPQEIRILDGGDADAGAGASETTPLPQRDSRSTPRPPRGRGYVQIYSTTAGYASLGRRSVGEVPGRLSLPAGRHRLTIRPSNGGRSQRVWVRVQPNRTTYVRLDAP